MARVRIAYWVAALISLAGLLAHEFLGAPMVLSPLADTDLPLEVIWLHHFSWHVGSIAVLAMVSLFIYAALNPAYKPMAVIATAMSLGFALLGSGLGMFGNAVLWGTPAPYLWSVVAVAGALGLVLDTNLNRKNK